MTGYPFVGRGHCLVALVIGLLTSTAIWNTASLIHTELHRQLSVRPDIQYIIRDSCRSDWAQYTMLLKLIGVSWVLEAQPSGSRRPFLGPSLLRSLYWSLSLETLQLSHGGNPLMGSLSIGRQMRFSWKTRNWLRFPWKKPVLSLLANPLQDFQFSVFWISL